jgi:hypothetical protein
MAKNKTGDILALHVRKYCQTYREKDQIYQQT